MTGVALAWQMLTFVKELTNNAGGSGRSRVRQSL